MKDSYSSDDQNLYAKASYEDSKFTTLLDQQTSAASPEDGAAKTATWKEKLYFFSAGSTVYLSILFTIGCYPVYSDLFSEYMFGFYVFLMGNLATFTYPFILYLVAGKSFNFQGSFTIAIILFALANMIVMAVYFPGKRLACYAIFLSHNVSMAAGFTVQYQTSRMLKYYEKACVQYFYSSNSFTVMLGTLLGFALVYFNASKLQYLFFEAAFCCLIVASTLYLQMLLSRDPYFVKSFGREARLDQQSSFTPRELWTSLKSIKWYFGGMFLLFTTFASITPAITTRMGPPSVSFEKWSNIQQATGSVVFLAGSWSIFEPRKSKSLVNALIFFSPFYCLSALSQFVSNNKNFMDSIWIANVVGMFLQNFQVGFYLSYLMAEVVRLFPGDKRAMFLMNYAISYGYLVGSLMTVGFAELRNRVHGIKE